jgi:hypothetical protein
MQLSQHLFDSFILPLGKPNTPLLDLGAFNSIIFPTARFLLSLPFAHLIVAVKNQLGPTLQGWIGGQDTGLSAVSSEEQQTLQSQVESRVPLRERVVPPPRRVLSEVKSSSSSNFPGSSRGRGGDDGGNVNSRSLQRLASQNRVSSESIASLKKRSSMLDLTQNPAYALLESLPAPPRGNRVEPQKQDNPNPTTPTQSSFRQFAFIPPSATTSNKDYDASVDSTKGVARSFPFTPKMPGFLENQAESDVNGSMDHSSTSRNPSSLGSIKAISPSGNDAVSVQKGTKHESVYTGEEGDESNRKVITSNGVRRKRVEVDDDLQPPPPRKTRVSPSKGRARAKLATPATLATKEEKKTAGPKRKVTAARAVSPSGTSQSSQSTTISTRSRRKAA